MTVQREPSTTGTKNPGAREGHRVSLVGGETYVQSTDLLTFPTTQTGVNRFLQPVMVFMSGTCHIDTRTPRKGAKWLTLPTRTGQRLSSTT